MARDEVSGIKRGGLEECELTASALRAAVWSMVTLVDACL